MATRGAFSIKKSFFKQPFFIVISVVQVTMVFIVMRNVLKINGEKIVLKNVVVIMVQLVIIWMDFVIANPVFKDNIVRLNVKTVHTAGVVRRNVCVKIMHIVIGRLFQFISFISIMNHMRHIIISMMI